jgi:biopolymer transport protein ExbD
MAGGGGGGDGEPEFQIAPMIDVLLVLLIFFMSITSAEVLKVDKGLTLPVSPNATKRDPEMAKHEVAVNIRWDASSNVATVVVDERTYPKGNHEELVNLLKKKLDLDKKMRVVLRGDRLLPAVEIQRVMDLVGTAGVSDISFAASNK